MSYHNIASSEQQQPTWKYRVLFSLVVASFSLIKWIMSTTGISGRVLINTLDHPQSIFDRCFSWHSIDISDHIWSTPTLINWSQTWLTLTPLSNTMLMQSLLSANWVVDQVLNEGQSRVSIDTRLPLPLEHKNQFLYTFQLDWKVQLAINCNSVKIQMFSKFSAG